MNLTHATLRNISLENFIYTNNISGYNNACESMGLAIMFFIVFACVRTLFQYKKLHEKTILPLKVEGRSPRLQKETIYFYNDDTAMPYKRKGSSPSPPVLTSTKSIESFPL